METRFGLYQCKAQFGFHFTIYPGVAAECATREAAEWTTHLAPSVALVHYSALDDWSATPFQLATNNGNLFSTLPKARFGSHSMIFPGAVA
jgi:hypothetical protein